MKKIIFFFFLFLFLLRSAGFAQITFQKIYGGNSDDYGLFGTQVSDGGYVIAGGPPNYLIKTDVNGNILWTKTYGGFYSQIRFVQEPNDGGFIIGDQSQSLINSSYIDFNLIKADSVGNLIWTKSYGGFYYDQISSVRQTNDSGYIAVGIIDTTDGSTSSYTCILLIKTNSVGDTIWTRTMGFGGEAGYSVQQTSDGGYIVAGRDIWTSSDVLLLKIDPNGNIQWSKAYGSNYEEYGYSVQQTFDGGFIISGHTYEGGNGRRVYLIKTDNSGNLIWSRAFNVGGSDHAFCVRQTNNGDYIIAGYFRIGTFQNPYHIFLIRTDSIGNPLWSNMYGGLENDLAYSVDQTVDGGFLISGYTESFGVANPKFYLIKTDSLGNSGCNQTSLPLVVDTPNTIVTNLTMPVINPVIYVTTPVFTVDSGGTATTLCFVGINEIADNKNEITIFPNPATDYITIQYNLTSVKEATVSLFNVYGQPLIPPTGRGLLRTGKQGIKINMQNIPAGIYFVKVSAGGKEEVRKVIKY